MDEDEKLKSFLRRKGVPIPPSQPGSIAEMAAKGTPSAEASSTGDDDIAELRFFDLDTVRERWEVPWGGWRVFFGLSGWTASFVLTAGVVAPVLLALNGVDPRTFDPSQKTEYLLAIQAAETGITFGVLWLLLRGYRDDMDAAGDWFVIDPGRDAFGVEKGWLRWALYGYVAVFVSIAVVATLFNVGEFAMDAFNARNSRAGTPMEAVEATHRRIGESARDAGEFAVNGPKTGGRRRDGRRDRRRRGCAGSGVGAERGSQVGGRSGNHRRRPAPDRRRRRPGNEAAVATGGDVRVRPGVGGGGVPGVPHGVADEVASDAGRRALLLRGLRGGAPQRQGFPQLVCLGMVLGFSYARTRNLLTPMTIHAMWNSGVLVVISVLMATGRDIPGL